jgi:hypothetical protein
MESNSRTIFQGYTATSVINAFEFWNSASIAVLEINDNGNAYFLNKISGRFTTVANTNRDSLGIQFEC